MLIMLLNWIVVLGIVLFSMFCFRKNCVGWFGLRFVLFRWNVYWFSFLVGSVVFCVRVLVCMLLGVVLWVGVMVFVLIGMGEVRYVIWYVIFVVLSCIFMSLFELDLLVNMVL